jgi:integrase
MASKKNNVIEYVYKSFLKGYKNEVKEQTYKSFVSSFESHILPFFKGRDICNLTKKDFLAWKDFIYSLHFKNSFNQKLYVIFNRFLRYCCDIDLIKTNYLKELGGFRKKAEIKKEDYYTNKEFKQFIKGFDLSAEIYKQFFALLFYGGLRPSEAMALKFSDLKGNRLSINKNIQRKGSRKIELPKNQSSIREIVLDRKTVKGLLKLKTLYPNCTENSFIFGGNKPLSPTTIDRKKRLACKKANIREITQHQFRHSHATLLLNEGIPITEISKRLGHSNVSTTLDIYTHSNLEQEKRVLKKLNLLHL